MQAQQQPSRFWFSHDWQAGAQELAAANDLRSLFNLVLKKESAWISRLHCSIRSLINVLDITICRLQYLGISLIVFYSAVYGLGLLPLAT